MKTTYDLVDKVVLVTGGTGGIGGATCRELLARGARVAVLDRDAGAVAFAAGLSKDRACGVVADVTDRAALESAVATVVDRFGRLDVAIANAGVLSPGSTLRTMPGHQADKVDLIGFSLGGAVAQMVALQAPDLVRRLVLAGTGPRGAGGVTKITRIAMVAYLKAWLTRSDPRNFLFFPRTPNGKKAATAYFARLAERTDDRDRPVRLQARVAQLLAIRDGGKHAPDDLSVLSQPVFVANGDHDLMVASSHSADMARRLPNAKLRIYPNSGHGGVFQNHDRFVPEVLDFLAD